MGTRREEMKKPTAFEIANERHLTARQGHVPYTVIPLMFLIHAAFLVPPSSCPPLF